MEEFPSPRPAPTSLAWRRREGGGVRHGLAPVHELTEASESGMTQLEMRGTRTSWGQKQRAGKGTKVKGTTGQLAAERAIRTQGRVVGGNGGGHSPRRRVVVGTLRRFGDLILVFFALRHDRRHEVAQTRLHLPHGTHHRRLEGKARRSAGRRSCCRLLGRFAILILILILIPLPLFIVSHIRLLGNCELALLGSTGRKEISRRQNGSDAVHEEREGRGVVPALFPLLLLTMGL